MQISDRIKRHSFTSVRRCVTLIRLGSCSGISPNKAANELTFLGYDQDLSALTCNTAVIHHATVTKRRVHIRRIAAGVIEASDRGFQSFGAGDRNVDAFTKLRLFIRVKVERAAVPANLCKCICRLNAQLGVNQALYSFRCRNITAGVDVATE